MTTATIDIGRDTRQVREAGPKAGWRGSGLSSLDRTVLVAAYAAHRGAAYTAAYQILGDGEAAEDAVQDAFLKLWLGASQFDPSRGSLRGLLVTIARHTSIDATRKRIRRERTEGTYCADATYVTDGPETATEAADEARQIREALSGLPADQRRAVEMAYFSGLTCREVADAMTIPVGTVKSRMRLAMRKLASALEEGPMPEPTPLDSAPLREHRTRPRGIAAFTIARDAGEGNTGAVVMTASRRKLDQTKDSLSRRMLVAGPLAVGVVAVAVLVLTMVRYFSGHDEGSVILLITVVGGACAIAAFIVLEIANVRLIRTIDIESARMRSVMAAMRDGVCCVDAAGRLDYMNPAAERMLGLRLDDHFGDPLATVFQLRQRDVNQGDEAASLLGKVLAGESYDGRDAVVRNDGVILPVDLRMAPIALDGERAGSVLAFADDTDRSREEQAKDDFVGFASHELRSPLTAMYGFSSWLAGKLEREPWRFDADTAEAIAALASETGRMESIIELFLDLTQIRMDRVSLEADLVDVTKLVHEEGAALRSRYPAAVMEEALPSTRVLAVMDEQRLRQVVLNLLDNAAKYGGVQPRIVVSLRELGGVIELRVKDSGSGIPREDQKHIFERFFRSPAPATGTKTGFGIGLYVTKQIVDRMGGELSFASEEGRGTEFTLQLPLAREEALRLEGAPEAEAVLVHG